MSSIPMENAVDASPLHRQIIQTICDLAKRPIPNARILDLACAHGQYSVELAGRGATVVAIEGRQVWLDHARAMKERLSLSNVQFIQDDVRNLSREKYGTFDIVLCLGILYHIDAPAVFDFLSRVYDVCTDFAIVETHIALEPSTVREWKGRRYWGFSSREHPPDATPDDKIGNIGASLDNEFSFWFSLASLCNVLRHVGFSTVYECRSPMANLYVGPEKHPRIWQNRVTLVAMKGDKIDLKVSCEIECPENPRDFYFNPLGVLSHAPAFNQVYQADAKREDS